MGLQARLRERTGASAIAFVSRFDGRSLDPDASAHGGAEFALWRALNRYTRLSLADRHWRNRGEGGMHDLRQNRVLLQLARRL